MTVNTAKCECLFCDNAAIARFTAPHLKPAFLICEEHLQVQMKWAAPYRKTVGLVSVDRI